MFTRQHYKAIAAIIKTQPTYETTKGYPGSYHNCTGDIAEKLADYFAQNNSRFNKEKFLDACGIK